jgi:hypothetical protein
MVFQKKVYLGMITVSKFLMQRYSLVDSFNMDCMYIDVVFHLQYKYANFSSLDYVHGGVGSVTFQLVKQRQDFSFGLFSDDISNVSSLMHSNAPG